MKNYNYLYLILVILAFCSCLSKRKLATGNSTIENDIYILNGTYKNIDINSKVAQDKTSLYLLLFKNRRWKNPHYNKSDDYNGTIRITAISDNKIKIERLIDRNIVETKTLKGKMYNTHLAQV